MSPTVSKRGVKIIEGENETETEVKAEMFTKEEARELLDELFEEETLLIGGMVAVHQVEDDFIWKLMKGLDQIRDRFLRRVEDLSDELLPTRRQIKLAPHPAIEHFLLKLKRQKEGAAL